MKTILTFVMVGVVLLSLSTISAFNLDKPMLKVSNNVNNAAYTSYNWAGYSVYSSSSNYNSASGSWIVPTIQATSSGYSSAWIGIGGFNGNSVIQIGTEQDCLAAAPTFGEMRYHGFNNIILDNKEDKSSVSNFYGYSRQRLAFCKPIYYSWWELYPQNAEQQIPSCSSTVTSNCITVSPGDRMSASVMQNSDGTWTLTITDNTKHQTFSTAQTPTFTPDQTSAEAIIERPALCNGVSCTLTNLANFGTINFINSFANDASLDSLSPNSITMVGNSGRNIIAQPSSISNPGTFSVKWFGSH